MKPETLIQPGMCVAVVGLGISGRAAVNYALKQGARVLVSEGRESSSFSEQEKRLLAADMVEYEAGNHSYGFLARAELVILSPGVPHTLPVIRKLQAEGKPVVGELAVAASHLQVPTIAVTGTNGKTTVTMLIGEILRGAGRKVFVGGNIGTPLLEYLGSGETVDVAVLEVSSFQLQMAGEFTPDVGVLLNISPDHLDRHTTMAEYLSTKLQLFRHQQPGQTAIIYGDDQAITNHLDDLAGQVLFFGENPAHTAVARDTGVVLKGENGESEFSLDDSSLGGRIGARNAAAAILATAALGITGDDVQKTLFAFQPPPHRLQVIGEYQTITYIDDSKATNTGAVIAALSQVSGMVVLIAGGRHKGEDYTLLRTAVAKNVRAVITIGEAADRITMALAGVTRLQQAKSMEQAVEFATELARPGDTVLLSPACASFDMFNSYAHRGEVFSKAVHSLNKSTNILEAGG